MGLGSFLPKMGRLVGRTGGKGIMDWWDGEHAYDTESDRVHEHNTNMSWEEKKFDARMNSIYGQENWDAIKAKRGVNQEPSFYTGPTIPTRYQKKNYKKYGITDEERKRYIASLYKK